MADYNDRPQGGRDTELVLPPNSYAFVQDNTKGQVTTNHGPYKTSLSNTDQLVTFDGKRFVPSNLKEAIQNDVIVPKGSYVILENPSATGKQPDDGTSSTLQTKSLKMGQSENLPGPLSFALWPGQIATVVKGHHLRSNQFVIVRVTDDDAAKANWDKSVVKGAATDTAEVAPNKNVLGIDKNSLVTGQLIVIKGTDVAFYIPPTGIEVLADETKKYTREAVTLERLEYSILLDEDGNKEYKIGPAVVFPTPTQQFFTKDGARKFRAEELQNSTGIHLKVIADYEEAGQKYTAGEELFITGETTPIYYPREEHATITYGGRNKTFAIAIPAGEGRYVLDRATGDINLVMGPRMFLPDPRKEVVVRRVLTDAECELYYPGNAEVLRVNRGLRNNGDDEDIAFAAGPTDGNYYSAEAAFEDTRMRTRSVAPATASIYDAYQRESVGKGSVGDALSRGTKYTPPRTVTLDTKFDGAIRIAPWSGFAVQVVNSKGDRRTVIGPQTVLLQYDEVLERLSLSKGKPKNSDTRMNTAYLRYISNPVSDIISLKTQDLVNVEIQVKYLVRFDTEQQNKWFSVDNYVQYMVDHLRSLIGNTIRNIGVSEFYTNAANILRDTVLGAKDDETGDRKLKSFDENGMTVYDLELIKIEVKDSEISNLLSKARQDTLKEAIELDRKQAELTLTKGKEEAERLIAEEKAKTQVLRDRLTAEAIAREVAASLTEVESENARLVLAEAGRKEAAEVAKATQALLLEIKVATDAHDQIQENLDTDRRIKELVAEASASEQRMKAVGPELVGALVALAQTGQLESIGKYLAPLSLVKDMTLAGTLKSMFAGTPLEGMLDNVAALSIGKR